MFAQAGGKNKLQNVLIKVFTIFSAQLFYC